MLLEKLDPFQKNVLFMFCGRKPDKIKCLIWEGDGFLLLYKRLLDGRYQAFQSLRTSAHTGVAIRTSLRGAIHLLAIRSP